jgi:uncharacterized membrane protein YedE/YeeE
MAQLTAFVAGLLFAAGLGVGGMTQPAKVIGFLDVAGDWDPSLAFVMLGAIALHATTVRWILRRRAPLFAVRFALPTRGDIDAQLVAGAALFGAGWGLIGYCPGPAVTALGGGLPAAAIFVPAMIAGMWVFHAFFERPKPARAASGEAARGGAGGPRFRGGGPRDGARGHPAGGGSGEIGEGAGAEVLRAP